MSNQSKEKILYFSGLNGLRAIAALAVVFSHINLALDTFGIDFSLFGKTVAGQARGYSLATYGVTIFFVLSGFLITYLILAEKDKQEIDIKKFYIRRILRIWPLYYLYLALALIALLYFSKPFDKWLVFYYVFFSANIPFFLNTGILLLHHYWSIGVEEQFYIFWPWIMKKIKQPIPVIILMIVIQLALRLILSLRSPESLLTNIFIVNRFDCMMIGGLGAIFYKNNRQFFLKLLDNKISQIAAFLILGLLILDKFNINSIVGHFIISITTLTLIVGQINRKNRIINLDLQVFDFLGKISFGIYIYHPLIIFLLSLFFRKLNVPPVYNVILIYIIVFSLTITIAYLSYRLFESKFIRMKYKFAIIKSSGSKNFDEESVKEEFDSKINLGERKLL
jgi:peptidoglycan/LPS O-acetylase OafA/YrhL